MDVVTPLSAHEFCSLFFFFLMIRRPPRSTQGVSSAASDVYKRQSQTPLQQHHDGIFPLNALIHELSMDFLPEIYVYEGIIRGGTQYEYQISGKYLFRCV
eukprot:TRINITY_DN17958_c0_g1_i1.p2 TRINITY_DN17958_c0_g1~~TRINITY_DN17958_c0_g1_i1.p2  ORF type:complete len:100 (-),score=16.99 TRINITY_DN17958_c0_g1_i1:346-645(-)